MANVANPRKQFQFGLNILTPFGIIMNQFLAQKVTIPEVVIDQIKHGEGNHYIKTAGMVNVGELHIEKLSTAAAPDNAMWDWIQSIQDSISGGGTVPRQYKKTIDVTQYAADGVTPIDVFECRGCWPMKINGVELSRVSSENTIESIEFSVDEMVRY